MRSKFDTPSQTSFTVYPKKYAHGFCFAVLCCGYTLTDFPISIRLTSLASNDCPSASKATLMNMDKYFMWIHYERLHNHNKAKHNKTVCVFLGIYCTATHWDQTQAVCHIWVESMDIKISRSVYALNSMPSLRYPLFRFRGSDNARWIYMNKMATTTGYTRAVRHIFRWRIYEFRVIMGIMTGLFGRCLWSTLGLRANDYVKTRSKWGFWLHHSSPEVPRCFTNNARAAPVIIP